MASKTLASLIVRIGADVSGATVGMSSVQKASRALKKEFTGLSAATIKYRSTMVALGSTAVLGLVIKNSMEAQRATAQLEAVLKSTSGASGQTMDSLNSMAAALQKTTIYGDEATKSVQGLLLTFTQIQGGTFADATKTVLDMATAMDTDLKSASEQVGKALNDPIKGITALTRVGVSFTDAQKDAIKQMVKMGDVAGAQKIILKELQVEFGGSAEAARGTLAGAIAFLNNQIGDFFEVSESGSGVFISAINSMGEAVIWVRENAMVPFFGGIQIMAADAAVYVAKLKVAWADLKAMLPGGDFSAAGKARDSLALMEQAAAEVRAEIVNGPPAFAAYKRSVADVGDEAVTTAAKIKAMLEAGTGQGPAPVGFAKPDVSGRLGGLDLLPFDQEMQALAARYQGTTKELSKYTEQFADSFAGAIARATRDGMKSFKDFADFAIQELLRIGIKRLLIDTITAATTPGAGGADFSGGPTLGVSGASTGAFTLNQNITFSVSAIDGRDMSRALEEQKGTIAKVVADAARGSQGYRRALAGA